MHLKSKLLAHKRDFVDLKWNFAFSFFLFESVDQNWLGSPALTVFF